MSILSNETLAKIETSLIKKNQYLSAIEEIIGAGRQYTIGDWTPIKAMIAAGTAQTKFTIGTQFMTTYTATNGTTYQLPWDLVGYQTVTLEDGTQKTGMILQAHYATVESVQFDAAEPNNTRATGGSADANVAKYGYNRWSESGIRAWLNSEEAKGNWFGSTYELGGETLTRKDYDVAPSQLNSINGFLGGLDSTFRGAIVAVKQNVATNTVTDKGVTDTTCDKIWLPSIEQMYGSPQASGVEGDYFHYWKDATELDAPSNAANTGRIIYALENHSSAQTCWLRSAYRGASYSAWYVYTSGTIDNYGYYAYTSLRCAPACVIC